MGRASKASIRGVALSVLEAIASRPLRVATEFGVEVEVFCLPNRQSHVHTGS